MRFVGIDIEEGTVLQRPVSFGEEAAGYRRLRALLGESVDCLVAMEATGHYWLNIFSSLTADGFAVALINPLRTRRFADEELERTKTDKVDAIQIARFAAQKRPKTTEPTEPFIQELRQLVRLRETTIQHLGDRARHLHHALDLTFPEFTVHVRGLDTELATSLLTRYPTAAAFRETSIPKVAALCFDGRRRIGTVLAGALVEAAKASVGSHQSQPYRLQILYACKDIIDLRARARELQAEIDKRLSTHEVGRLLTTLQGVGTLTAAYVIAEVGDPARFRTSAAFASYVGVVPRLHHSGKRKFSGKPAVPLGNARLRRALWMPVIVAVRVNPWLRAYYHRLRQTGKPAKVAIIAAMHKLLTAIYSVAKHRRPFVPVCGAETSAKPRPIPRGSLLLALESHLRNRWRQAHRQP